MPALEFLDLAQREAVHRIVASSTAADGVPPLSEHVWLHLREGGDDHDLHFLAHRDGQVVGYAHLDLTDHVDGPSAEIVVDPRWRGQGVGRALMAEVIALSGPRLRLWSHGDLPVAAHLSAALGFQRIRTLIQMRRSLLSPLPHADLTVRGFQVRRDEAAWLTLNAQAFRDHPEQGHWTQTDLDRRLSESWFDPEGFLIHERDGQIVAFCWTKVHGRHGTGGSDQEGHHSHDLIGEIYVIGVDPKYRGEGLGRALTIAGLRHLRSHDVPTAMLFVDATNTPAIAMYQSLGFAEWGRDVMYRAGQTKNATGK